MDEGFVLLHRKVLDSPVFAVPELFKVWMWCLCRASYCRRTIPMKTGRGETLVSLEPGQFVFGRKSAARELNMAESTVQRRINRLEKLECLNTQPGPHWTLISVVNWHVYQPPLRESGQATAQAMNGQRAGIEQPTNTNNNGKNFKKGKKSNDDDGARCISSLREEELGEVFREAHRIGKSVRATNSADDRSLILKAAALVHWGDLSHDDLEQALEAVRLNSPKKPVAYFHKCLAERTGGKFNALLARVEVSDSVIHQKKQEENRTRIT